MQDLDPVETQEWLDALESVLDREGEERAHYLMTRMGELAVPELVAATKNPNPSVQTWAAISLGQTESKKPGVQEALAPLKASTNPHVQFAATEALNRLSGG